MKKSLKDRETTHKGSKDQKVKLLMNLSRHSLHSMIPDDKSTISKVLKVFPPLKEPTRDMTTVLRDHLSMFNVLCTSIYLS